MVRLLVMWWYYFHHPPASCFRKSVGPMELGMFWRISRKILQRFLNSENFFLQRTWRTPPHWTRRNIKRNIDLNRVRCHLSFHLSLSVSNPKRQKEPNISQAPICFTGVISQSPFFFRAKGRPFLSFYHSVTSAPILPVQVFQTNRSRNSRQRPLRKSPQRCLSEDVFGRLPSLDDRWPNFGDFPETLGISETYTTHFGGFLGRVRPL